MKSAAADVDSYIAEQPPEWQAALERLRTLCQRELPGFAEAMAYGGATYARDGVIEIGFTKQVRYLSLYVLQREVLDAHRPLLAGTSMGKGCIRYPRPDRIDWDVVTSLLRAAFASHGEVC